VQYFNPLHCRVRVKLLAHPYKRGLPRSRLIPLITLNFPGPGLLPLPSSQRNRPDSPCFILLRFSAPCHICFKSSLPLPKGGFQFTDPLQHLSWSRRSSSFPFPFLQFHNPLFPSSARSVKHVPPHPSCFDTGYFRWLPILSRSFRTRKPLSPPSPRSPSTVPWYGLFPRDPSHLLVRFSIRVKRLYTAPFLGSLAVTPY